MSVIETCCESITFNRTHTLATLERVMELGTPMLGWRPGPERAHAAWQFMHIGVTEELFATERLRPDKRPRHAQHWKRFRGGSTPDDDIPPFHVIREVLDDSRTSLLETLRTFNDHLLDEVVFAEREWTLDTVLKVLSWHESFHLGQIHLTVNLYLAR